MAAVIDCDLLVWIPILTNAENPNASNAFPRLPAFRPIRCPSACLRRLALRTARAATGLSLLYRRRPVGHDSTESRPNFKEAHCEQPINHFVRSIGIDFEFFAQGAHGRERVAWAEPAGN